MKRSKEASERDDAALLSQGATSTSSAATTPGKPAGDHAVPGSGRVSVKRVAVAPSFLSVSQVVVASAAKESLHFITRQPPSVLKGLEKGDRVLAAYGVFSVADLGQWDVFQAAKAMHTLNAAQGGKAPETSHPQINLHRALETTHEAKSLPELLDLPISTLVAVGARADKDFALFGLHSVRDLALWKQAHNAEALTTLSVYEYTKTVHL